MRAVGRRDTRAELAVRSAVHGLGLRFRVDRAPAAGLRSRADLVFSKARVAVYIDGCFWHSCPLHATVPRSNEAWWREKLAQNRLRDRRAEQRLQDAGWQVIRIWEHERPDAAAERVASAVRSTTPSMR